MGEFNLFDDYPIVVDKKLAKIIGLNEAIVLQHIHYWLINNERNGINFKEGRYWTFNSIKKWQEETFYFWSIDTVKRIFKNLEQKGLLIAGNFNKKGYDRTKWYTIDYQKLYSIHCNQTIVQNAPMQRGKMHQCNSAKCPNAIVQNAPTYTKEYTNITTKSTNTHLVCAETKEEITRLLKEKFKESYTDEYRDKIIKLLNSKDKDINYLKEKLNMTFKNNDIKSKHGYLLEAIKNNYKALAINSNSRNKFNNFTGHQYTEEEILEKLRRKQERDEAK